eukprot:46361_1
MGACATSYPSESGNTDSALEQSQQIERLTQLLQNQESEILDLKLKLNNRSLNLAHFGDIGHASNPPSIVHEDLKEVKEDETDSTIRWKYNDTNPDIHHDVPISLPADYMVIRSPGIVCKKTKELDSEHVGNIDVGSICVVEEQCQNRLRISSPFDGWVSLISQTGEVLLQAAHIQSIATQNAIKAQTKKLENQLSESAVWQFQDGRNWRKYTSKQILAMEALLVGETYTFHHGNHQYIFHKKSKTEGVQQNLKTKKSRNARRTTVIRPSAKPTKIRYPKHWSDQILKGPYHKPQLMELDLNHDNEAIKTSKAFFATVPSNKYTITKIERIHNCYLWDKFYLQRESMKKLLGKEAVNDKYLWHGSSIDIINKIIRQGFRKEFNYKTAYGDGSYFATNALYSVSYCKSGNGTYQMLYCGVLCGESRLGTGSIKLTNWPNRGDSTEQIVDSLVNNLRNPTIYVIHDDFKAYPYSVVHFKKR